MTTQTRICTTNQSERESCDTGQTLNVALLGPLANKALNETYWSLVEEVGLCVIEQIKELTQRTSLQG